MSELFFVATAAGPAAGGFKDTILLYAMLILGLVAYWFLILRPHNKKRKETQDKLSKLSKGDKIVTIGGIHGKVASVKDTLVVVKVDDNTEITFDKTAIATVLTKKNEAEQEKAAAIANNKEELEKEDEKK